MQALGDFLADARKTAGLTQRQVESASGISNAYLSQLETGKVKTPAPKILHSLAKLYSVSYALLMQLAEYPLPEEAQIQEPQGATRLAARIGKISPNEEEALVDYLRFLRAKGGGSS